MPRSKENSQNLKEEAFARHFVFNGLNATKAYKAISPDVTRESALVLGHRFLKRKTVQNKIMELVPDEASDLTIIKNAYNAKKPKVIAWSDLHKYLETSLKLKGKLDNPPDNSVKIALVVHK